MQSRTGNQSKSWSMSEPSIAGKAKCNENQTESKGFTKGTKCENKGTEGSRKCNTLEMGQVDDDDRSWIHEEWSFDERNDGWSLTVGTMMGMMLNGVKIVNKHMSHLQALQNGRR